MPISKKPRHWIALAIAVAALIFSVIQFADFSGEPPPAWRKFATLLSTGLLIPAIVYNLIKDGQK